MGFEHARRGYDCLVTTWKRTRIKNFCWTMDKRGVAVTVVRNVLLKRKRRAAERLERVREKRRAFLRRQAMERLMFVALMTLSYCNLSPERTIWSKERSSHWWEHACCKVNIYATRLVTELPHVAVYLHVLVR